MDYIEGNYIRQAIVEQNEKPSSENAYRVVWYLRNSFVWIPVNLELSEKDQKWFEDKLKKGEKIEGQDFSNQENIKIIPDIFTNKSGELFFPVFTDPKLMGEYGNNFSKVEKHFLEAINLADNCNKDIKGIIVDPFTTPYFIGKQVFDIIKNMKSIKDLDK